MGNRSSGFKAAVQGVFYIGVLAVLTARSVSAPISHDEIQFIVPGQLLAYHAQVPYVDYPYTHMPYGILLYAGSALISTYDYLAARLVSSLTWMGTILLMVAILRSLRRPHASEADAGPSWGELGWEFLLVLAFINHGPEMGVMRTVLNHGPATLFTLLSVWFMLRGLKGRMPALKAAALSGACITIAGLIRFNFASLAVVMLGCWLVYGLWFHKAETRKLVLSLLGGMAVASLPALTLLAVAPKTFYYSNLVYIRLNTAYYEGLLYKTGMSLPQKVDGFIQGVLLRPLETLLYLLLLSSLALAAQRIMRRQSEVEVARLALCGFAAGLWLSAFAPTPTLIHYFAGPIPFLFVLLGSFRLQSQWWERWGQMAVAVALAAAAVITDGVRSPVTASAALARPSQWPPVQVHTFAMSLKEHIDSGGILTLNPVIPLEAGYDAYPFTATGPFTWRTSLLLTADRRREYGVTSPEELDQVLDLNPPAGILVGWEGPNAGFGFQDQGGLERPFEDYAVAQGYTPIDLSPPFWSRGLTLWIRP